MDVRYILCVVHPVTKEVRYVCKNNRLSDRTLRDGVDSDEAVLYPSYIHAYLEAIYHLRPQHPYIGYQVCFLRPTID